MLSNRGINDLPLEIYTNAMLDAGISYNQITSTMSSLSKTCRNLYGLFRTVLSDRIIQLLAQAVIDDDHKTVVKISIARPDLLLPLLINGIPKGLIIESKCTFQKFDLEGENILSIAVKQKQMRMIEALISCFTRLPDSDSTSQVINNTLSQWSFYEIREIGFMENRIVVPEEYTILAQSLIEEATTGVKVNESENRKLGFRSLLNKLFPEKAVKLDDNFNVELFLIAIYKVYIDNFSTLQTDQRTMFYIHVIGLIQSVLTPETPEIFKEANELRKKKPYDHPIRSCYFGRDFVIERRSRNQITAPQTVYDARELLYQWETYLEEKQRLIVNLTKIAAVVFDSTIKTNPYI